MGKSKATPVSRNAQSMVQTLGPRPKGTGPRSQGPDPRPTIHSRTSFIVLGYSSPISAGLR